MSKEKKDTEFLMRTVGRKIVKTTCVFDDEAEILDKFIDEQDDERQILCVLCRISYQLENIFSAINKQKKE